MYAIECSFNKLKDIISFMKMENISMDLFSVTVVDQSVFLRDKRRYFPEIIDGGEFHIFADHPYVFERLILLVNPRNDQQSPVYTRDDFEHSCCEMVILVYDAAYIEVYVKKFQFCETLYQNAIRNNAENLILKVDRDDMRQHFHV